MRPTRFHAQKLVDLFKNQKIATLAELKSALGTNVDVTVFRKLKELDYCTSYSHRGQYYTLKKTARFDRLGLWSCRFAWFSKFGTLLSTTEAFVNEAKAGYFADDLADILHVRVKEALVKLIRERRISREKVAGRYLYCSKDHAAKERQLLNCRASDARHGRVDEVLSDDVQDSIVLLFSLLNEKQRRLYAGLESLKLGRGGDLRVAELLGLDVATVAKGRQQLLQRDVEIERVRRTGGGRKRIEKKRRRSSPKSKS